MIHRNPAWPMCDYAPHAGRPVYRAELRTGQHCRRRSKVFAPTVSRTALLLMLLFCLASVAGCQKAPENSGEQDQSNTSVAQSNVELSVLVVDDPQLSESISHWGGEWGQRTGGSFVVSQSSSKDLLARERIDADLVIYPARLIGTLAERGLITPLRSRQLENENYELEKVFDLLAYTEARWGEDMLALPLGSPVLMLYYRRDMLEQLGRRSPSTWEEYQQLVKLLAKRPAGASDSTTWFPSLEPTGDGWAGLTLLARAAGYARHRNYYSTLFDIDTLEPHIAGPAFVRALEEMVEVAEQTGQPAMNPAQIRAAVHRGECALALSYPTAASQAGGGSSSAIRLAELPGSQQVINPRDGSWQPRGSQEESHVTLLSVSGRLGSVTSSTLDIPLAQRLLAWLSGAEMSVQILPQTPASALFRESHLAAPGRWVEASLGEQAAEDYAQVMESSLQRPLWLIPPRIPGSAEYLAALDAGVRRALQGEEEPAAALQEVASRWEAITEQYGRESQRTAYLHSLGE